MTRIALDASGGDFAPEAPVAGALDAIRTLPKACEIVLVGSRVELDEQIARHGGPHDRITIVDAPEKIGMDEKPLAAIRTKRRSSVVVGVDLHHRGDVDAFISAGNTGAVMAACTLLLGLHDGIERPAIGTLLPTDAQPVLLLDCGANVDCSARELMGFAQLGAVYARDVLGRGSPAVGLLNIGEEREKGTTAVKEAHELLARLDHFRFIGNVEGGDVLAGECDVVACDGFVGNVLLKFFESVGRTFAGKLNKELDASVLRGQPMRRVFDFLDYSSYGGAPLLGVRGVAIVCHGRSSARAIANAIRVAVRSVDAHLTEHIHDELIEGGAAA